jgi:hypothetical protein
MRKMLSLETYGLIHFSFDTLMEVGKFLQLVSTFLGGFFNAFARGWLLSLVMLSSIPPVVGIST